MTRTKNNHSPNFSILSHLKKTGQEKHYGKERLEKGAARALKFGAHSFQSLRKILSAGLDRLEEKTHGSEGAVVEHENIRGSHYYNITETKDDEKKRRFKTLYKARSQAG
jgi:hypothetical protein